MAPNRSFSPAAPTHTPAASPQCLSLPQPLAQHTRPPYAKQHHRTKQNTGPMGSTPTCLGIQHVVAFPDFASNPAGDRYIPRARLRFRCGSWLEGLWKLLRGSAGAPETQGNLCGICEAEIPQHKLGELGLHQHLLRTFLALNPVTFILAKYPPCHSHAALHFEPSPRRTQHLSSTPIHLPPPPLALHQHLSLASTTHFPKISTSSQPNSHSHIPQSTLQKSPPASKLHTVKVVEVPHLPKGICSPAPA